MPLPLKLPHECVDPDDGEDQPEDETHEQHVEDTGQRADQRVHDDLHALHLSHGAERPQGSQRPHSLEDGDVGGPQQAGREVDDGHGDNHKVEPTPGIGEEGNRTHSQYLDR